MRNLKPILTLPALAVSALAAIPAPAAAYTYSTITTFNNTNGAEPESSMIRSGNKFYGVTENTVFRYNSNNTHFDVLWTACMTTGCAYNFFGKLVIDTNGNLYGTAVDGGRAVSCAVGEARGVMACRVIATVVATSPGEMVGWLLPSKSQALTRPVARARHRSGFNVL